MNGIIATLFCLTGLASVGLAVVLGKRAFRRFVREARGVLHTNPVTSAAFASDGDVIDAEVRDAPPDEDGQPERVIHVDTAPQAVAGTGAAYARKAESIIGDFLPRLAYGVPAVIALVVGLSFLLMALAVIFTGAANSP